LRCFKTTHVEAHFVNAQWRYKHPIEDVNTNDTFCKRPTEVQTPRCERKCKCHHYIQMHLWKFACRLFPLNLGIRSFNKHIASKVFEFSLDVNETPTPVGGERSSTRPLQSPENTDARVENKFKIFEDSGFLPSTPHKKMKSLCLFLVNSLARPKRKNPKTHIRASKGREKINM
ncbi:hypothetical protein Taro_005155, partial [Colocasia esculenta]|nr:hypothetical protein [Colocasia esculenta]